MRHTFDAARRRDPPNETRLRVARASRATSEAVRAEGSRAGRTGAVDTAVAITWLAGTWWSSGTGLSATAVANSLARIGRRLLSHGDQ